MESDGHDLVVMIAVYQPLNKSQAKSMLAKLVLDKAVLVPEEERACVAVTKPKAGNVSNWKYVLRCSAW